MVVDLHSHILPNIDDGPKTVEQAVELVKLQLEDGINVSIATPHFNPDRDDITEFLQKRVESYEQLKAKLVNYKNFDIKNAAEVLLHPKLLELPLKQQLCIEGTSFMLTELPWDYWPEWVGDVLFRLQLEGITPILAHVEKYSPVLTQPNRLYKLVSMGMLVQINATTITKCDAISKKVFELINHNLAHFIATDTHSVSLRPPQMKAALQILEKKFDGNLTKYLSENAIDILNGITPEILEPLPYKDKGLLKIFRGK
jgi:protein-tyrosine phosphatase